MTSGIYGALSGMKAKQLELEKVAHNLANAGTTSFKEEQLSFAAVMGRASAASGSTPYTMLNGTQRNFSPGTFMETSSPLDLAIAGDGFFEVQASDGQAAYTRNGAFTLNAQGDLVTNRGDLVMGANGALNLQGGSVQIASDGSVSVEGEQRGKLKVVQFSDMQKLQARGGTDYLAPDDVTITPAADATVMQGRLEASNTNVVLNLVKLIEIARQYQTYQQVINEQSKIEEQAATSIARLG